MHRSRAPGPLLWRAALFGPLLVGLSAGLQVMLVFLNVIGPTAPPVDPAIYSHVGLAICIYSPEYDLPVYAAGCAACVLLSCVAAWLWTRWARRLARTLPPAELRHCLAYSLGLQVFLSALSWIFSYLLYQGRYEGAQIYHSPGRGIVDLITCLTPAAALLACVLIDLVRVGRAARRSVWPAPGTHIIRRTVLDFAIPALICCIVYIPVSLWAVVASQYCPDYLHHLNFFVMNPAVAYANGLALGSEAYSQYGVGWPTLLGGLSTVLPLSYANAIGRILDLRLRVLHRRLCLSAPGAGQLGVGGNRRHLLLDAPVIQRHGSAVHAVDVPVVYVPASSGRHLVLRVPSSAPALRRARFHLLGRRVLRACRFWPRPIPASTS